ncbi:hypothetical protein Tco_1016285 [Tanacetum coccineum]|uniref:Reverse transcriptase Ty1/copia-type domain-containing protein n=1 Tax=Tanacetum coccineum TaxID=301880 RepID=A0ABQ5FN59_9ASTR
MMTPRQLNSGFAPSPVPATTYIPLTDKDLEILFQPMFDEYFEQSTDSEPVPTATVVNAPIVSTNTSVSTTIAQDAPSTSHSLSSLQVHPTVFPQGVTAGLTIEDTSITQADLHPSVYPVEGEPSFSQSTSGDVSLAEQNQVNQPPDHLRKWTKDHPLDNIVSNPSRPVSTRKQLASDALCQPEGFEDPDYPTHVYHLKKALYGLKQALLVSSGFTKSCLMSMVAGKAIRIFIAIAATKEYDSLPDGCQIAFLNG